MKVSLPVFHKLEARYKRHRNSQGMSVYSYHDFEVEEISGADAPIVAQGFDRNNTPVGDKYSKKPRLDPNPTGILRFYDDSFWYPEFNKDNEPVLAENWTALQPKGVDSHLLENRFWDELFTEAKERKLCCEYRSHSSLFDEDEIRDIQVSNLSETLDYYASRISADVRAIDGVIYHRTSEPIYAVAKNYSTVYTMLLFSTAEANSDVIEFFSLDRHDEMVAQLEHFKELFPEQFDGKTIVTGSKPEICMHGLLQFNDDTTSMLRAVRRGFRNLENELKDMSREAANFWFDLKEALQGHKTDPSVDNIEAVGAAYARLADSLKADTELCAKNVTIRSFVASADYALTRWEMRDISLDVNLEL